MRQRREDALDPREYLGCRGYPRWRDWRRGRLGGNFAMRGRFSSAGIYVCRRRRRGRLPDSVSRGEVEATIAQDFVDNRHERWWLGFWSRLGCEGHRD